MVRLTHEPELTHAVDLCDRTGRLSPDARGWSRMPLHRCNLSGRWGRTKRWDYWAVLSPTHTVALVYADVDYLGIAEVWWADLRSGRSGGRNRTMPLAHGISLPDRPGTEPLRYRDRHLDLSIEDDGAGTHLRATWTEPDGARGSLLVTVDLPPGHESLNVVIPWSDRTFQYTSKHQARPARGVLEVGGERTEFGGAAGPAWGVLDVGRGRWPYRTRWNWGGGAGSAVSGEVVGLQLGGKWTDGTGFTENGVIVDGVLHKVGGELAWDYSWERPMHPWRVVDPEGRLDLRLVPRFDKHTKVDAVALRTEVHQLFGSWSGTVVTDDGRELELRNLTGFAEESRSRW